MAARRLSGSNPNPPFLQRVCVRYLQFPHRWVIWLALTIYGRQPCGVSVFSQSGRFSPAERGGPLFRGSRLARWVGFSEGRDQPSRLVFENEWYDAFVVDTAGRIFCVISTSNGIYAHSPRSSHKPSRKAGKENVLKAMRREYLLFSSDRCAPFLFQLPPESLKLSLRNTDFNLLYVFYSAIE